MESIISLSDIIVNSEQPAKSHVPIPTLGHEADWNRYEAGGGVDGGAEVSNMALSPVVEPRTTEDMGETQTPIMRAK